MSCDSGARCSVTTTRPDEGFWNLTHAAAAAAMLITNCRNVNLGFQRQAKTRMAQGCEEEFCYHHKRQRLLCASDT